MSGQIIYLEFKMCTVIHNEFETGFLLHPVLHFFFQSFIKLIIFIATQWQIPHLVSSINKDVTTHAQLL